VILGLIVAPFATAALFIRLAPEDASIGFDVVGWAQVLPFALVPLVIGAGLQSVAASEARRRGRVRADR
jgi:hypothetical protein